MPGLAGAGVLCSTTSLAIRLLSRGVMGRRLSSRTGWRSVPCLAKIFNSRRDGGRLVNAPLMS